MNPNPFPKPVGTVTGNTGGTIYPDNYGNLTLIGSGGTTVSGSGNTLTISGGGSSSLTWNNGATSTQLVTNNGYIITAGAQTFTMPSSATVGDAIVIALNGGTSWTITVGGAPNSIRSGTTLANVSANASAASMGAGTIMSLVCVGFTSSTNQQWLVQNFSGTVNLT